MVVLAKIQQFQISQNHRTTFDIHLTILRGKNCVLLISLQDFMEIEAWLFLTVFTYAQTNKFHTFHRQILKNTDNAVPRRIFIPSNWYGRPKNEPKFLKTSPIFFNFNQFNNCPFFLHNYFITLFSCLASESS